MAAVYDAAVVPVPADPVPPVDVRTPLNVMLQLMQGMQQQQQQFVNGGGQVPSAMNGSTVGGGHVPSARAFLDERYVRRVDKFNNKESSWKEWRAHFISSIREASSELSTWMSQAEGVGEPISAEKLLSIDDKCPSLSASLFNKLLSFTTGTSFALVESVS